MNIEKMRQEYIKKGYTAATATAKVCQDIILKKIYESSYVENVTLKGGIVMHNISNNRRRATLDIDLDFIRYSIDDESILNFFEKLNENKDGLIIRLEGKTEPLHHQDYNGKRVNVIINDSYNQNIKAKLDIGVHKNFALKQEKCCFDLDVINETVTLYINSIEQIFIEKLKSLLKHGIFSTRFKDIFDFYYLITNSQIDKQKFKIYLDEIIFNDTTTNEKNIEDIVTKLKMVFSNRIFIANLKKAKNNWLDEPVEKVLNCILSYIESFSFVKKQVSKIK